MTHNHPISNSEQRFKSIFIGLIEDEKNLIFTVIERKLNQFKLRNSEPFEILSEVYKRGIKAIKSGQQIKNPTGWIWKVSEYVIVEQIRQQKKHNSVVFNLVENKISSENFEDELVVDDLVHTQHKLTRQAFDSLKPQEQKILDLRLFQEFSWKKVGEVLSSEGEKVQSHATLRKRGQRAIERLRKIYLSLHSGN